MELDNRVEGLDLDALEDEAVARLQEYIRLDTTNPPGNEALGVEFFARIFEAEGIPYESVESAPGRGNIWACLEGGPEPGLILLSHMDVVPADESFWSHPPLSGDIKDGFVRGRGTLDMKGIGIIELHTFLALHRMGKPLNRDVMFMATADEEAGGFFGAGWLAENRKDLFDGYGLLLNEGGGGQIRDGKLAFGIEVTQKVPLWLRLTATGKEGHGSTPHAESAVTRLVQALSRIHEHQMPPKISPAVDAYFKAMAPNMDSPWREAFGDISAAVKRPVFLDELRNFNRAFHALVRNTCSMTKLEGSSKINVIPHSASAELDCRLVPNQDPEEFVDSLRLIVNDPAVTIEKIMSFTPAESSTDTDLYRAIESVCQRNYPDAPLVPSVMTGFTDSHFFRDLGIACYGFIPTLVPAHEYSGIHGHDERISVMNVKLGTRLTLEIVQEVVHAKE